MVRARRVAPCAHPLPFDSVSSGAQAVGLPVGTYQLKIAGQTEPITVKEGKITEF